VSASSPPGSGSRCNAGYHGDLHKRSGLPSVVRISAAGKNAIARVRDKSLSSSRRSRRASPIILDYRGNLNTRSSPRSFRRGSRLSAFPLARHLARDFNCRDTFHVGQVVEAEMRSVSVKCPEMRHGTDFSVKISV